ncbi:MAG: chloride channel protein, partial [Oscillospiraceae bacterium]
PSFGAGLGMVSLFCGVTNCPLSSLLLALELFAASGTLPIQSLGLFAVSIAVSYMLSGYYGLYSEQKILYSKFRPEFIDRKANQKED